MVEGVSERAFWGKLDSCKLCMPKSSVQNSVTSYAKQLTNEAVNRPDDDKRRCRVEHVEQRLHRTSPLAECATRADVENNRETNKDGERDYLERQSCDQNIETDLESLEIGASLKICQKQAGDKISSWRTSMPPPTAWLKIEKKSAITNTCRNVNRCSMYAQVWELTLVMKWCGMGECSPPR